MRKDLLMFGVGLIAAMFLIYYILPLANFKGNPYTYYQISGICSVIRMPPAPEEVEQRSLICPMAKQMEVWSYVGMIIGGILLIAGLYLKGEAKRKKHKR